MAGDQYLDRTVSSLDCNSSNFAVSPPYFELNNYEGTHDEAEAKVDQLVPRLLLRGNKEESQFEFPNFILTHFATTQTI